MRILDRTVVLVVWLEEDCNAQPLPGDLGVDERFVLCEDGSQGPAVLVHAFDVEIQSHCGAGRESLLQIAGCFKAEAFDRLVRMLGFGRIHVKEPNGLFL